MALHKGRRFVKRAGALALAAATLVLSLPPAHGRAAQQNAEFRPGRRAFCPVAQLLQLTVRIRSPPRRHRREPNLACYLGMRQRTGAGDVTPRYDAARGDDRSAVLAYR